MSQVTLLISCLPLFFFFNDTATTEIYTLSLHDALPICSLCVTTASAPISANASWLPPPSSPRADRKSTRLNSSHVKISYAVFCLKKKKQENKYITYKLERR